MKLRPYAKLALPHLTLNFFSRRETAPENMVSTTNCRICTAGFDVLVLPGVLYLHNISRLRQPPLPVKHRSRPRTRRILPHVVGTSPLLS